MRSTTSAERAKHTRYMRNEYLKTDVQRDVFDRLRKLFPVGSTVYTSLDGSPSRSGMMRWINVHAVKGGEIVYAAGLMSVMDPGFWKRGSMSSAHPDSLKVGGCGMDMGFHVAYTLSRQLYGDGYALAHRWI